MIGTSVIEYYIRSEEYIHAIKADLNLEEDNNPFYREYKDYDGWYVAEQRRIFVSWGENDIIIVKYTDSRPLLSENMYFFVSGDELILCGEKGFSKYIKKGEVIFFENYGVIP